MKRVERLQTHQDHDEDKLQDGVQVPEGAAGGDMGIRFRKGCHD